MSGIIIFPIVLIYIFAAFLIYKLVLRNTNKKFLSMMIFIGILTFPFWDLIIQKGIKTIFEVSGVLEPKIYAYPEKDENGMIESLSLVKVKYLPKDLILNDEISIHRQLKRIVKDFYETSVYNEKEKFDSSIFRINIDGNSYSYVKEEYSRFRFIVTMDIKLFGLYKIKKYQLIDTKKNILLGDFSEIIFLDTFSNFRQNILLLQTGNGNNMFYVSNIKTDNYYKELMKKLEIIQIGE
ncbi:MAG: hypothetical protein RBR70_09910 [Arcobacter sp.]|jgi:hypothetical protein|uniref:hypothetical protein n=1 Tax=Arcobacter sp. TaxID=1872629 RepID=UPI002A75F1A0|nr:hypothetical protein [Arcobacter sp.]MDY3205373.1 hypothetical protein [Arcobacter sp.]